MISVARLRFGHRVDVWINPLIRKDVADALDRYLNVSALHISASSASIELIESMSDSFDISVEIDSSTLDIRDLCTNRASLDVFTVRSSGEPFLSGRGAVTSYSKAKTHRELIGVVSSVLLGLIWSKGQHKAHVHSEIVHQSKTFAVEQLRKRMKGAFIHEQWRLGVTTTHKIEKSNIDFGDVKFHDPSEIGTFTADPFLGLIDGSPFIFYEYLQRNGKGVIRCRPFDDYSAKHDVLSLERDGHLSYPFVLIDGVDTFVVPEQSYSSQTSVYKVNPNTMRMHWEFNLFEELGVVDPTIFRYGDRYWMFGTISGLAENCSLFLWHSNDLCAEWQPHRQNPVTIDVGSARPGGTIVNDGEGLRRFGQNSLRRYGGSVADLRIQHLDESLFVEKLVGAVVPKQSWPIHGGLHNLAVEGEFCVIDVLSDRFEFGKMIRKL